MNPNQSPQTPEISDLIAPHNVELRLRAESRDEVLNELVRRIPEIAGRSEAALELLRVLSEREDLHSTGIGDGVAIPHARNAVGGLVSQPVIVFGRHPTGIPFRAIDHQPVRLFFLIVATSVTEHLHVLARISRLMRRPELRQGLMSAESVDQVLHRIREAEQRL